MNKNGCHLPPASADTKPAPISSIVKESGLYRPHVTPSLSIGKLLQCSIQKVSILMIFLSDPSPIIGNACHSGFRI